ncbi:MAG: hypothetical protein ACI8T1_001250 [Verrucomicrobiales bacterium]
MHKEILILSWLDGQMRFVFGRNGETVAKWECLGEPEDLGKETFKLSTALRIAVKETGFTGKNFGLVLEHGKLTQQLLSTPPAKGRDLELYIERQVDQLKVVDAAVAISWMETEPIKTSKGLMLYLFPTSLREKLIAECREAGLHLLILVAPTALLNSEIAKLSIADDEIVMIAAQMGQSTAVVIGGKEGAFFLARSLRCNWKESPERLNSELNRSTIFLRQQFGKDIGSVWLVGDGADEHAEQMRLGTDENVEQMRGGSDLSVKVSPVGVTPYYWAEQMLTFSPETDANVINSEQRNEPRRKMLLRITGGVICLLIIMSLSVVALIEFQIRNATKELEASKPNETRLMREKDDLERQFESLRVNKEIARLVQEEKLPPVSGWFLSYLATMVPSELVLTKVEVRRVDNLTKEDGAKDAPPEGLWKARLEGVGIVTTEIPPNRVKVAFKSFSHDLTVSPFHLVITDKTKQFTPRSIGSWISTDGTAAANASQFYIEGVMRGNTIR